jgi:hypothetical protein
LKPSWPGGSPLPIEPDESTGFEEAGTSNVRLGVGGTWDHRLIACVGSSGGDVRYKSPTGAPWRGGTLRRGPLQDDGAVNILAAMRMAPPQQGNVLILVRFSFLLILIGLTVALSIGELASGLAAFGFAIWVVVALNRRAARLSTNNPPNPQIMSVDSVMFVVDILETETNFWVNRRGYVGDEGLIIR